MKRMMMIRDDDDYEENVVVKILVLVNEILWAMIFSYYDYLMKIWMK
jgi:hypothetical protein